MTKTYHGSCHCGALKYEAELDLSKGTYRCNCSYCRKTRNWIVMTQPDKVTVTTSQAALAIYKVTPESPNDFAFCSRCGVRMWTSGFHDELGGDFLNLAVATLDGATADELDAAPVSWIDGLHDDWMSPPARTSHL